MQSPSGNIYDPLAKRAYDMQSNEYRPLNEALATCVRCKILKPIAAMVLRTNGFECKQDPCKLTS